MGYFDALLPKRILISRLSAYFARLGIFFSYFTIVEHSGCSRCRWIASNAHLVVHRPQPMHLFSVKVSTHSRNGSAFSRA